MKKDIRLLGLLLLLFSVPALVACEKEDPDCFQANSILTRLQFRIKDSVRIDSLLGDTLYIDTTIIRYGDTTLESPTLYSIGLQNNWQTIGSYTFRLGVPLDPDRDTMFYVLKLDTSMEETDTLRFIYSSFNHFISNNCGFTNFYELQAVSSAGYLVDSVAISNSQVTNSAQEAHVQLYFFVD